MQVKKNPYGTADAQGDFCRVRGIGGKKQVGSLQDRGPHRFWTHSVSDALVAKRDVKFYIVIKDTAGNQWGSMYEVTDENTFAYTVTRS